MTEEDDNGEGVIGNNVGGGKLISSCLFIICIRTARRDEIGDVCIRGRGATITGWGWLISFKNQSLLLSDDNDDVVGIIAWHMAMTVGCIEWGVTLAVDDDDDGCCG